MSDKQTGQASQRKPSTNKNIKKLRTISMVCSLARSWQQWVTENENKQATEPSGWAPSWMRETTEEPKKQWVPKKSLPTQNQPTEASQHHVVDEAQKTSVPHSPHEETQDAAKTEEVKVSAETLVASPIKTKQVVKTVTSGAQEKSVGIGILAEKIKKEALPSEEEIDKLLKKKSSPTLRRKCSNMVVSLTKSWKQVENEQKLGKVGGGQVEGHLEPGKEGGGQVEGHLEPGKEGGGQVKGHLELGKEGGGQVEGHPCGVDREDSGHPEVEETLNMEDTQEFRTISMKEAEEKDSEEDSESEVKIKRSTVSTYTKEAEDANKINALSKKYSTVGNLKSRWQNWASEHTVNQKLNPFSEYFDHDYSMSLRLQKGEDGYGRPKEGTKTAERAKRAEQHIHREIDDMCDVLRTMADPDPDGKTRVTFGELFDRYVRISDKVVGILLRARKHGKVAFEGEMLWQGQDDGVIITLLV